MIPKIIHYVWVGGKPLTKTAQSCIETWRECLPEYEIKLWNEENSPMDYPYVRKMYEERKWAFVSDYIRFWALEREGGIYLDTDMEVLKPLDRFLEDEAFFGRTNDGYVACGIIGATAHHPFIKGIVEAYDELGARGGSVTSPQMTTTEYEKFPTEHRPAVYDPEVFYPFDLGERHTPHKLERAYTNHLWDESWIRFRTVQRVVRRLGILKLAKWFISKDWFVSRFARKALRRMGLLKLESSDSNKHV